MGVVFLGVVKRNYKRDENALTVTSALVHLQTSEIGEI